jgi:hypothetical protein
MSGASFANNFSLGRDFSEKFPALGVSSFCGTSTAKRWGKISSFRTLTTYFGPIDRLPHAKPNSEIGFYAYLEMEGYMKSVLRRR